MRLEHAASPNKKEKMTPHRCHMSGRGPNHVTLMSYHPGIFPRFLHFGPLSSANISGSAHIPRQSGPPSPRGSPPQINHRCAYVLSPSRGFATLATARHPPADRPKHSSNKHSSPRIAPLLPTSSTIPPSHRPHVRHKGDSEGRDKTSHL